MSIAAKLFFFRIPILALAIVVGFAGIALFGSETPGIGPVLNGLFTLASTTSLFWVSAAATLVGLGANTSINLILEHGLERILRPTPSKTYPTQSPSLWIYFLVGIVPSVFFSVAAAWLSRLGWIESVAAIIGGILVAHAFVFTAVFFEVYLSVGPIPPNMLIVPLPKKWIKRISKLRSPRWMPETLDWLAELLHDYFGNLLVGYIYLEPAPGAPSGVQAKFYPGMIFNTFFLFLAFLYWASLSSPIWFVKRNQVRFDGSKYKAEFSIWCSGGSAGWGSISQAPSKFVVRAIDRVRNNLLFGSLVKAAALKNIKYSPLNLTICPGLAVSRSRCLIWFGKKRLLAACSKGLRAECSLLPR